MTAADLDIDELVERMGLEDEADVREVVGYFLETAAPRLDDLSAAVATRDAANTRHHAHAAKGAARSVGAVTLTGHLVAIEQALASDDWSQIETSANELKLSLDKVKATLDSWKPKPESAE